MHVPLVSAKTLPFNRMYLLRPTTFDFCYVTKPVRFIETKPINRRALNSCTVHRRRHHRRNGELRQIHAQKDKRIQEESSSRDAQPRRRSKRQQKRSDSHSYSCNTSSTVKHPGMNRPENPQGVDRMADANIPGPDIN
mgnify:CR=1 FL=1